MGASRIARTAFDEQPGAGATSLALADTGRGMSQAESQKATAPFCTTREDSPLAGLSLPAVLGLVEQSGGTMRISSQPGSGTTVTLTLASWGDERMDKPDSAAARMDLMLVDKRVMTLELSENMLKLRIGASTRPHWCGPLSKSAGAPPRDPGRAAA